MRSMSKLVAPLAFVGLSFALSSSMASADVTEDLERMVVEGLNEECDAYARVLTNAEWAAVQRSSRAGDFSRDFKDSLFKVEKVQCVLTQRILVLEMLREEATEEEWASLGGDEGIQSLREMLINTFPR